jgi:DNA replication protein DnaC
MATTKTTMKKRESPKDPEYIEDRLKQLGLYGALAHLEEIGKEAWLPGLIEDVLGMDFLAESANVVLAGPNGVGKTMIAQSIGHRAVLAGHTVLFTTASKLLNDLAAQETGRQLTLRLRRYVRPSLLLIDEVGYLASTSRHADLLFEVVARRYQTKSIVLTTNKPFAEWNDVFEGSACVVSLVDRLVHKAEIVQIEGESYRLKEARERAAAKAKQRKGRRSSRAKKTT